MTRAHTPSDAGQVLPLDVPLSYPNPLHGKWQRQYHVTRHTPHVTRHNAGNTSFDAYGGTLPLYQGGEFFKFYYDPRDLQSKPTKVRTRQRHKAPSSQPSPP